jgi:hypothetical protein
LRVLDGERLLGRVVGRAFASEDEEAVEPSPVVDREDVSACAVLDLIAAGIGCDCGVAFVLKYLA